ncbi:CGL136 [Auxenochlorella protothecoides x Auxenochlorella symbiontica]
MQTRTPSPGLALSPKPPWHSLPRTSGILHGQILSLCSWMVVTCCIAPAPSLAATSFLIREQPPPNVEQYFETIPGELAQDLGKPKVLSKLMAGPKGPEIQACTRKCLPACLRGGQGSPGLGPMSMRKELVVFKSSFHTRNYCLSECSQVCALISNAAVPKP